MHLIGQIFDSGIGFCPEVSAHLKPGLIPIGIPMLQCAGEELKELRKKAY